jgi:hypothetical protein
MAGTSLADMADLLGHTGVKTAMIYAGVEQPHLKAAVNRLGEMLSPMLSPESVTCAKTSGKESR